MVDMDCILTDFTLEKMLSAFSEETEVGYQNDRIDRPPEAQIEPLRVRYLAYKSRETTAQLLLHASIRGIQ